ncbi:hypothetical protein BU17DRAFT_72107 [Hysterangium stoloniferum]|nr:hypothetical protein BU17DRAFT_72107 [Hysterangium stoloniferum]
MSQQLRGSATPCAALSNSLLQDTSYVLHPFIFFDLLAFPALDPPEVSTCASRDLIERAWEGCEAMHVQLHSGMLGHLCGLDNLSGPPLPKLAVVEREEEDQDELMTIDLSIFDPAATWDPPSNQYSDFDPSAHTTSYPFSPTPVPTPTSATRPVLTVRCQNGGLLRRTMAPPYPFSVS